MQEFCLIVFMSTFQSVLIEVNSVLEWIMAGEKKRNI